MLIQNNRFLAWMPPLTWLILTTVVSVLPGVQMPQFNLFAIDKFGHALAYAGLTALSWWALRRLHARAPTFREGLLLFCFAAGYGALMEFVQGHFLPGRFFELDDMLANNFGAATAWLLCYWQLRN